MSPARKPASHPAVSDDSPSSTLPIGSAADAPHGSRPEQVYCRLRDLIVEGAVAPGSRIVETQSVAHDLHALGERTELLHFLVVARIFRAAD